MKRFALALGVVAFVLACSDATTAPTSQLAPNAHILSSGRIPPPPVDAAITVTISSVITSGPFNGTYFSNGTSLLAAAASTELADPSLSLMGTAWLRFDNNQPDAFGTTASANARFQRTDQKLSGMGTLVINGVTVSIDEVTSFTAFPDCDLPGQPCAIIAFNATVGGEPGHRGTAEAFDRAFCTFVPFGEGGGGFYRCGGE
ncbi:MAG TPA: hypothetical protein VHE82_11770 [Gemmatimonadaceae bacterium]|nr:hypothetical protein [Gemmatimonadaceae bacterium]